MKTKDAQRILSGLAPKLDGYRIVGKALVSTPSPWIMRAILIEDTSDSGVGYLWAFVQPLFVPFETFSLGFGERLPERVRATPESIDAIWPSLKESGAIERLSHASTDSRWLAWLRRRSRSRETNSRWLSWLRRRDRSQEEVGHDFPETLAGMCVIEGEVEEAMEWLDAAERHPSVQADFAWQREYRERVAEMRTAIGVSHAAAIAVLRERAAYTSRALGLVTAE